MSAGAMTWPLLIERAGARGEDQIGLLIPGGVGVRSTGKQAGTADKLHGHGTGVCHAAVRQKARHGPAPRHEDHR
jgi:hypothetical protein